MTLDQKKAAAYEALLKKLFFEIPAKSMQPGNGPDIGAVYVKFVDERIVVAARPIEGARMNFFSLNPAVAFYLANAIWQEGEKAGWFVSEVAGSHPAHKGGNQELTYSP